MLALAWLLWELRLVSRRLCWLVSAAAAVAAQNRGCAAAAVAAADTPLTVDMALMWQSVVDVRIVVDNFQ